MVTLYSLAAQKSTKAVMGIFFIENTACCFCDSISISHKVELSYLLSGERGIAYASPEHMFRSPRARYISRSGISMMNTDTFY